MAITAREAQDMRFDEARRGGLDDEQVGKFRQRVIETLQQYEEDAAKFRTRLEEAEQSAIDFKEAEEAVKRTFLAASRTKREMIEEAEADSARLRAEADSEVTRLRSDVASEIEEQRAAAASAAEKERADARAEAKAILSAAKLQADEAEQQTRSEVERLERRLTEVRTALADLEGRLKLFAETALDDVVVIKGLVDLETSTLDEIEAFQAPEFKSDA